MGFFIVYGYYWYSANGTYGYWVLMATYTCYDSDGWNTGHYYIFRYYELTYQYLAYATYSVAYYKYGVAGYIVISGRDNDILSLG